MDFDEAIAAHSQWKTKLSAYLTNPDGSLDAATVSLDTKCPLGQWIAGDGLKHSALPEYARLKTEHTRFHKAAGEVVRKASSGQKVSEDIAIGGISEFCKASSGVVLAIMAIKAKAAH